MFGIVGKSAYVLSKNITFLGGTGGSKEADTTGTFILDVSGLGLSQDDLIIVSVGFTDSAKETDRNTSISGYTKAIDISSNDVRDSHLEIFYKVMGSTPDSSITVSVDDKMDGFVVATATAWRNVDPSNPLDVSIQTATGTNTNYANPPAITPVTQGAYILGIIGATAEATVSGFSNLPIITNPSGVTFAQSFVASAVGDLPGITRQVYYDEWVSGAYDMGNFVITPTSTDDSWTAATLALRPKP